MGKKPRVLSELEERKKGVENLLITDNEELDENEKKFLMELRELRKQNHSKDKSQVDVDIPPKWWYAFRQYNAKQYMLPVN